MPQKCLREVFGLGLHETMSVGCKQSMKDETKFDIELQVKERPAKTADIELEWPIAPTAKGRPGLATLVPGELPTCLMLFSLIGLVKGFQSM